MDKFGKEMPGKGSDHKKQLQKKKETTNRTDQNSACSLKSEPD